MLLLLFYIYVCFAITCNVNEIRDKNQKKITIIKRIYTNTNNITLEIYIYTYKTNVIIVWIVIEL